MADIDLSLELEKTDARYLPGEPIRGTVRVRFERDVPPSAGVLLRLHWRTSGPGDVENGTASERVLAPGPFSAGEQQDIAFDLPCPEGPFSTSHSQVSVGWELEARVDVKWAVDPVDRKAVRVLPGPCENPFLGSRAEDVASQSPTFLSSAEERRRYDTVIRVGALGFGLLMLGAWLEQPWLSNVGLGVGGVAPLGAGVLYGIQRWRRSRYRGLTVELPNLARTVEAGCPVEGRLLFTPTVHVSVDGLAAGWLLEEYAEDTSGTKTRTFGGEVTRLMTSVEMEPMRVAPGEQASLPFSVTAPHEPSYRGVKNRLDWSLLVRMLVQDGQEVVFKLPVLVRPPRPGGSGA